MLNCKSFIVLSGVLALAACDNADPSRPPATENSQAAAATQALPTYETNGVITSLEGQILTLDHEGASAAGLKAGRDQFTVYADVVAEAPITPGSRVKVRFRKTPAGLEAATLEPRT